MRTEPLLVEEKHFVRSRFLFAAGLWLAITTLAVFCAGQSQATIDMVRFAWLGGMILGLAASLGLGRLALRLGRSLRKGTKTIQEIPLAQKSIRGRNHFFLLDGKWTRVSPELYEQLEKGTPIAIHRAGGTLLLRIEPQS